MFATEWERHDWKGEPVSLEMFGAVRVYKRGRKSEDEDEGLYVQETGTQRTNWRNSDWWDARWATFGQLRQRRLASNRRRDAKKAYGISRGRRYVRKPRNEKTPDTSSFGFTLRKISR